MNPRLTARSAFTLVEIVVALALAALLAVACLQLVVHAAHSSKIMEERATAMDLESWPEELLAADLAARPAGGALRLNEDGVQFATLNALQTERDVARCRAEVTYRSVPESSGTRLDRMESSAAIPSRPDVVLVRGARSIRFSIWDGQTWHNTWPPPVPLPARALRMELTRAGQPTRSRVFPLQPLAWRRHGA